MARNGRAAVAAVVLSLLAGCGSAGEGGSSADASPTSVTTPRSGTPSTAGSPSEPAGGVPQSLTFTATTVDGKPYDAAALAGKPVVFWFWAAWCPRCRAAASEVASVQRDFTGKVNVVGVAGLDSGDDAMREFVTQQGIDGFVNLADDEGTVWRRFEVTAQEYYVLLDGAGAVVHKGPLTPRALRERVTALAS